MGIYNAIDVYNHVRDTSPSEHAILAGIALWAKDDPPRKAWYSYRTIAEKTCFSRNAVIAVVRRLKILGHIKVKSGGISKNGVNQRNIYTYIRQNNVQQTRSTVDNSVDNSVDKSVDKSGDNAAPPQQVVHKVGFGSAGGGFRVVQEVDSKRNIKKNLKESEAGSGGGVEGLQIAIKGWGGREVTPEMERRIVAKELKRIVNGWNRRRSAGTAQAKTPVQIAAAACGMRRFRKDHAKTFREVMYQRNLPECLKVMDQFDKDRKGGKLTQCVCLPIELMSRLAALPKCEDSAKPAPANTQSQSAT